MNFDKWDLDVIRVALILLKERAPELAEDCDSILEQISKRSTRD